MVGWIDMKNWSKMAEAAGLDIPDIGRITPALDALEAAFRPLTKTIAHDAEAALQFHAGDDSGEESL
jgi:hypothetical protein